MASSLIGSQLGKYQIIDVIGQGGMAAVYKGYHPEIERYAAIKVLPPHPGRGDAFVNRFQLEARTIARLQHPHILPLYDYGVDDNIFYLAMAYVEGGSLSDRIHQGPMPLQEVEKLLRQIASALDYAHRQGIIHRDIKPANILLDKEGHALLADFGIAKLIEGDVQLTATGGLIGTPAYMSPEQCQGLDITGQSDIYALGVVAYEMITGQQPFIADTPMMVAVKHITEPVPQIRKVMDSLPARLEPVMMRVLAKSPEDRYDSALEFTQDFAWAIYDDPALAELQQKIGTGSHAAVSKTVPLPPPEPFLKRLGKNPLALLGIFLSMMAFLIVGLTGVNQSQRAAAAVNVTLAPDSTSGISNAGLLSFGTTNVLGDTVNLRVDSLVPPGINQTYTVWLKNTQDESFLRLGDMALDALGSGALVYADPENRTLPAAFNSAVITLESKSGGTGSRSGRTSQVDNGMPKGQIIYSAQLPSEVAQALGQILSSSPDGIGNSSLLDSAISEAQAAIDNTTSASQADLGSIYTHAEHLINILSGSQTDYNKDGRAENPGRGVGVISLLDKIDAQLDTVAQVPDIRLQSESGLLRTCLENTRMRVNNIVSLQQQILGVETLDDAVPLNDESNDVLAGLIDGADQNGNGRVEPFASECGLGQIAAFALLISNMELTTTS